MCSAGSALGRLVHATSIDLLTPAHVSVMGRTTAQTTLAFLRD
jgi:hypothetical protein